MKVFKNKILKSFKGKGGSKSDADVNYSLMAQPNGSVLRSTDFLSSLDLLCEGEIEGFVNPDGALVEGIDVLQGIYLNDVPILEVENSSSVAVTQGPDTLAPQILILGDNPTIIELGTESFVDEGAITDDNSTVSAVSNVNDQVLGSYTVTYTATDASGNTATAIRVVNIVDTEPPVITIIGDNPVTVEPGTVYTDAGATSDGSENVTVINNVNTNILGPYQVIYSATDASGNTGTAIRVVNVEDIVPPVITILGDNPLQVFKNSTYNDPGATADGNEVISVDSTVNTSTEGTYTVTYSATDAAGNTGTATRTVEVIGNIVTFFWGTGSFNANAWTYDSQENRWSYDPGSGSTTNYLEKDSLNRWRFYNGVNLNNPGGLSHYLTQSSYTSDFPLDIPHSDWTYVGNASSSSPITEIGLLLLESDIPSSGSSITLQGFSPDGFNGTYTFNSDNFTYTRTDSGITYTIELDQHAKSAAGFRWIAYYTGSNIYFWSDDFDPDTDIDNILDVTLGGFTNKISIHANFPQAVIGTISENGYGQYYGYGYD